MKSVLLSCVVAAVAGSLSRSQSSGNPRTLSIAGRAESVNVVEINGKSYVEIQELARLTRGSLSFEANRILLTLPTDGTHNPTTITNGFSKQFMQAAIEQLSDVREWRITIVNSIENNSPVSEQWVLEMQRRAQKNLALVGAAQSTSDDRKCYPLLATELANMQKLSDRFLSMRRQLKYIDPNSLKNDPLDRQILACAHSLASMAADNQFRDEMQCFEVR